MKSINQKLSKNPLIGVNATNFSMHFGVYEMASNIGKKFKRTTKGMSSAFCCWQIGLPKMLMALSLLVLSGTLKPLHAASGLAAPLKYMPIYADYDWELREAAPRADGYVHVDTPALIAKLIAGHITTYAYLCLHSPSDWNDFRLEFMPAAQAAGINVWLYLAPPTEVGSGYVPYGYNYVSWASAAGQLAQTYPNLTGLAIDDFDSNEGTFTPSYVNSMMAAAHTYSPGMAFLPVNYDASHDDNIGKTISTTFVNAYGPYISGVIFPYLNWANYGDCSGEAANIAKNAGILGNIPLIAMIYDNGYGSWFPTTGYVTEANNIAYACVLAGTARGGIIQYKLDKSQTSTQFPIIQSLYNQWEMPPTYNFQNFGDFDGDGLTDYALWIPSTGMFNVRSSKSAGTVTSWALGQAGDIPLIGSWTSANSGESAVYRPSTGTWYVRFQNGIITSYPWGGNAGDVPLIGAWTGRMRDEVIFRPSTGAWYIRFGDGSGNTTIFWGGGAGNTTDIPLVGNFGSNGGMVDQTIFRPTTGEWFVRDGKLGYEMGSFNWGGGPGHTSDIPLIGAWSGQMRDAVAFRPSTGMWYIRFGNDGSTTSLQFGQYGDVPMVGNIFGHGMIDQILYRPSTGMWYVRDGSPGGGTIYSFAWGDNTCRLVHE
jgi:hypothetical protein